MTRTPVPRITGAREGTGKNPFISLPCIEFAGGVSSTPRPFPAWTTGPPGPFPVLRDLSWETPELRPAPYLQGRLQRRNWFGIRCLSPCPLSGLMLMSTSDGDHLSPPPKADLSGRPLSEVRFCPNLWARAFFIADGQKADDGNLPALWGRLKPIGPIQPSA